MAYIASPSTTIDLELKEALTRYTRRAPSAGLTALNTFLNTCPGLITPKSPGFEDVKYNVKLYADTYTNTQLVDALKPSRLQLAFYLLDRPLAEIPREKRMHMLSSTDYGLLRPEDITAFLALGPYLLQGRNGNELTDRIRSTKPLLDLVLKKTPEAWLSAVTLLKPELIQAIANGADMSAIPDSKFQYATNLGIKNVKAWKEMVKYVPKLDIEPTFKVGTDNYTTKEDATQAAEANKKGKSTSIGLEM